MKKILIFLTILSIPAIWSLLQQGGYEPHDLHHIADIYQMSRAASSGQIPPRLGPDFLYGFGYPLFNYYYVLPFYIGALIYGLFGSLMVALKGVFLISLLLSVYGMYFLLRKFFGKAESIAGAALYLYTPFRAVEVYVRGAIGEAFAIALLPWVLWGIATLFKKTSKKNIAVTAFIFALFLLTHNYFFLLVAPFAAVFTGVLIYFEKHKVEKIRALFIAGLLGAGLSAYWWLPAFAEYGLVSAVTPFVIEDHFPFLKQLILPSWGYGSSVWGPYDLISFQIGLVNLAVVFISIPLLLFAKAKKNTNYLLALTVFLFFGASIFMMNIRSMFLWNIIPFTNFIQFPWRLLSLTTFFTAILAAFVIGRFPLKNLGAFALILFSVLFTFSYFRPSKFVYNENQHYLNRMFANPEFSEDYLLLPHDSVLKPDFVPASRFSIEGGQVVSETKLSAVHWQAEIQASEDTKVEAYVLNIPGWFVRVNGEEVATYSTNPYGHISFDVPEGVSKVELDWEETNLRLAADVISLISVIIAGLLYFRHEAGRATI